MSNIAYSDCFNAYRIALALWTKKQNYMLSKYRMILDNFEFPPDAEDLLRGFLEDLSVPCDSFISDFEMKNLHIRPCVKLPDVL